MFIKFTFPFLPYNANFFFPKNKNQLNHVSQDMLDTHRAKIRI